jgi:GT2 family glycosyltransferase
MQGSTMSGDVAVVIGNYEGEHVLRDCLESLAAQTQPLREVIVVDGASTDGSRRITEQHGARFLPASNQGLGFLYNRGVEASEAEYVLLLNNDVALEGQCVELLAAELASDGTRFAADPTQLDWAGDQVIHARTTLRRGRLLREFIPGLHLDAVVLADEVVPTVSAHGAAMLVRRSMFLELGGFDETSSWNGRTSTCAGVPGCAVGRASTCRRRASVTASGQSPARRSCRAGVRPRTTISFALPSSACRRPPRPG